MEAWQEFGLNGLIMGSVVALLFFVIKWTLATTKDILNQTAKERECWTKAINDHTEQARAFHESVKEAHQYQRLEHAEIVKALGRINGYKKDN